ncbi:MAG: acyltransferase [Mesorhizobium sp.]|nr:nitrilase-related carbon-nitrogen hydrolase [Mesorhizobium sp. M1E.F.Ca.ET.063.01.1.1]RUW83238.1 acyltransferase [Mesorhizobium sp. M1E.F.Ca.ET.063.01.1.1]TIW11903.1 MAG: acyltransferase [Mesorhizobium sp.]
MTLIKCGLVQLSLKKTGDAEIPTIRDAMLDAYEAYVERAAAQGVQIICFPELFNQYYFGFGHEEKWFAAAERIPDGPTVRRCCDWAKRYGIVIVAPIYEEEAPGVYYNTAAVVDADGSYLGKYRKMHIPDGGPCREKLYFKPGNLGFPVFQTAVGRIGVVICNDRHFPEGFRALALGGAEVVFVPTSTGPAARPTWELELKAAAFANGIFVAAPNRVGDENSLMGKYFGNSLFASPWGETIAQGGDGEELVVADLDTKLIREQRIAWGFFHNRRPDAYPTGPHVRAIRVMK